MKIYAAVVSALMCVAAHPGVPNQEDGPQDVAVATDSIPTHRFSPCTFWTYSTDARGYVCINNGISVTMLDAYGTVRVLNAMDRRITALEARLGTLEALLTHAALPQQDAQGDDENEAK